MIILLKKYFPKYININNKQKMHLTGFEPKHAESQLLLSAALITEPTKIYRDVRFCVYIFNKLKNISQIYALWFDS